MHWVNRALAVPGHGKNVLGVIGRYVPGMLQHTETFYEMKRHIVLLDVVVGKAVESLDEFNQVASELAAIVPNLRPWFCDENVADFTSKAESLLVVVDHIEDKTVEAANEEMAKLVSLCNTCMVLVPESSIFPFRSIQLQKLVQIVGAHNVKFDIVQVAMTAAIVPNARLPLATLLKKMEVGENVKLVDYKKRVVGMCNKAITATKDLEFGGDHANLDDLRVHATLA